MVVDSPISKLAPEPRNDLERKAHLALTWIERALLANEPLAALLFLFFSLEAMLGDRSEKLKGHDLAFRQAMLSLATTGYMIHPSKTYLLYDGVRSAAVHGGDAPPLTWEVVTDFRATVLRAFNQYLEFALARRITTRARLLRVLDEHAERPALMDWLRAADADRWRPYLDRFDPPSQPPPLMPPSP